MSIKRLILVLVIASPMGATAGAHSLHDVEKALSERESFVELRDEPAPPFTLQDADGHVVSLSDFHDKVVILNFIFASCTDVCPVQSELLASIQRDINQTPMRDLVQFVTVTTDPKTDTPEILKAYGPAHGLDSANWVFLTSGPDRPDDTRNLALRYGLKFMPTEDGQFMHGVVTHLIDKQGVLRARYHGLKFEPTNLIVHVNALVNDYGKPHAHAEPSFWARVQRALGISR